MTIIDTHQHLWDFDVLRPSWLRGAGLPLERSYTPAHYAQAAQGSGIVQSVYVEVGADAADRATEAGYVAEQCDAADTTLSALVAGGDIAAPDFEAYLERLEEIAPRHLCGIRSPLPDADDAEAVARFVRGAELLAERGPYHVELLLGPDSLGAAAQMAARCPGTVFIINHCGGVNPWSDATQIVAWQREVEALAILTNVVMKVSGLINRAPTTLPLAGEERTQQLVTMLAPVVNHVWDRCGPERVVFGTDWPVCNVTSSLGEWVRVLRQIAAPRSQQAQNALFFGNAKRWYRL